MNPRDREHWAFRPPKTPQIPRIRSAAVQNPIDAFLLAELERKKLSFSPQADRITLLRRACFDLIGLPPTPEEVDQFLADKSPDAYEMTVDRLMASPRYGERWARHWLDVAGYADSKVAKPPTSYVQTPGGIGTTSSARSTATSHTIFS